MFWLLVFIDVFYHDFSEVGIIDVVDFTHPHFVDRLHTFNKHFIF